MNTPRASPRQRASKQNSDHGELAEKSRQVNLSAPIKVWTGSPRIGLFLVCGKKLDGVHHGVVYERREREFYPAIWGRLNIVEGLNDRRGTALRENVKVLQKELTITDYIEDPAAWAANPPILFTKPWLTEIDSNPITSRRGHRNVVASKPPSPSPAALVGFRQYVDTP